MKAITNIIRRTGALLLGLGLLGLCGPRAQGATAIPMANNGDAANRIDFVFVSEGYRASEMGKFAADAENARQLMFAQEPFKEYQKFFNVYRVEQASNDSGSDHPERVPPVAVDTAFDSGYGCGAIDRLICADNNKVANALSEVLQANQRDVVVLLVNDDTYGGSGGSIAVASTNAAVVELVLHEIGHSFGLLADEYGSEPAPGPVSAEPTEANATLQTARGSIKWRAWISDSTALPTTAQVNGVPGAYRGAKYQPTALYRPTYNSKMRELNAPYEQINTEQLVKRYYNLVSPIDSFSPTAGTVEAVRGESKTFSIASPQPRTHALTVKWTLNGVLAATGAGFTLETSGLAGGSYTLSADVVDETAMVRSDPAGVLRDSHRWIVNVRNPGVTLNSPSILEGEPGTSASLTFTATLEKPSSSPITVNYATLDDSAIAGEDYVSASGTLSFAPGETSATFAVLVTGDALVETDEIFKVTLSSDTLVPEGGTGTIVNDDLPTIQVAAMTTSEGNSGTKTGAFAVTLSQASSRTVTVNYATADNIPTADGNATAGSDYRATSGTLSFAPGETSKTIDVTILGDLSIESSETFVLTLSDPVNAALPTTAVTGTITNDDAATISISDVKVNEDNAVSVGANFTVRLSGPSSQTVKVNFATENGAAIAPGDYTAQTGTLTFAPGETSKLLTIAVRGDTIDEPNETFQVKLSAPVGASISDDTGLCTIFDNDAVPTLSVKASTVAEGNAGTTALNFEIRLSNASDRIVSVQVKTVGAKNLPATSGSDYIPLSNTISFAPGEFRKIVSVSVKGDVLDEENEHVALELRSPVNAALGVGVVGGALDVEGTIADDDAVPSLSISDVNLSEGNSGIKQAVLTVLLSAPSGREVTVSFATLAGSATAGSDYAGQSGSLTFAPGQTRQTIAIPIFGDSAVEATESFKVTLSNSRNAGIAHPTGIVTILNDDSAAASTGASVTASAGSS